MSLSTTPTTPWKRNDQPMKPINYVRARDDRAELVTFFEDEQGEVLISAVLLATLMKESGYRRRAG